MTRHLHTGGQGTSDWLMGAVRSNPEGLLLLAAGCALLLRSGSSKGVGKAADRSVRSLAPLAVNALAKHINSGGQSAGSRTAFHRQPKVPASMPRTSARPSAIKRVPMLPPWATRPALTPPPWANTLMTHGGIRTRWSGRRGSTLQGSVSRLLQEQPLALAAAGLAAGAMVAATFPATAVERRTLGPAGERLSEAASSAGQQLSQAASKAGERLMSVAEERGLNTQGLKEPPPT